MEKLQSDLSKPSQDNENIEADIRFHVETASRNFKQACDRMILWVRENRITPE